MYQRKPSIARQIEFAIALLLALHGIPAGAGPMVTFDIPAQPLSSALPQLAGQAGVRIVCAPETTAMAGGAAVMGEMTIETALERVLAGTGMTFKRDGERNYRVIDPARPSSESALPELVVTATRTERYVKDVPASVTVVGSRDIARQQPPHIADLLRNVEGIDVAGYGSPASLPMVSLRGIGGSFGGQTSQMLIDGLPIESPVTGIHQGMHALDLQDLARVEILRGPASALYGPSAVGGVVNFVPKRWRGAPGAELSLGSGSHGATMVSAAFGGAWDTADFRLSGSDFRTDGYLAQPDADPWGAKDLAPRDGRTRKFSLTGGLRPRDNQEITFAARHGDAGSAWLGGHPNYRFDNNADSLDLGYRFDAGDWTGRARYRHSRQKTRIRFDDEYVNGNIGSLVLAEIDDRVENNDYLDIQADLRLGPADLLTFGYNHGIGEYTSRWTDTIYGGDGVTVSKSTLTGIFVQDEHRVSEALTLLAGGRWDRYRFAGDSQNGAATGKDSDDGAFNPRLGARYRLSEATSFYATAGTAYVPALNFLKFRSGGAWLDNPGLKPETSVSYEIGADHRHGDWSIRATLFHSDYQDKISSIRIGSKWQFQNIGKSAIDGLEMALEGKRGDWRPYANYAYTDSRIKENPSDPLTVGKRVQRIAPHKFNLGAVYIPSDRFYIGIAGRYVDDYYFNDRNTADALNPAHFVADAKIGWRLPTPGFIHGAEASLAVNNLFAKRYREQQYEYMDGRSIWLGLSAEF